jgi:phosphoribosylglycinamide formyltransferase-1
MAAATPLPDCPRQPLRIAVLISGGGSTLANLIERIADARLRGVQIVQVISSRGAVRGVEIARAAALPLAIVRRKDFADEAAFSAELTRVVDSAVPDIVVLAGFLCLWRFPPKYSGRVLNIHPALLPAFGGRGMYGPNVHRAVLESGALCSGCTVHLADEIYDHGRIVAQREVPILPGDTAETLAARVMEVERELLPEVLQRIADEGTGGLAGG